MDSVLIGIVCALVGALAGAVAAYRFFKPQLTEALADRRSVNELELKLAAIGPVAERVNELQDELARVIEERDNLKLESASDKAKIAERENALEDERRQLGEATRALKGEFALLSAAALEANSKAFLETAKGKLDIQQQAAENSLERRKNAIADLVTPLQTSLDAVREATRELETKREKAFGTIESQLKETIEQSEKLAIQAAALKDALKKPTVRGRWGEVQLANCVELAGMDAHCDFVIQSSSTLENNVRVRPDMIVRMPGGRKIVVDAKTPMEYFLAYIEASTDEEKNAALMRHASAVKQHVEDLAKTDYMQKVADSPDFVVMFLPNESFLAMALERAPDMMEHALRKKVMIVTPGTLIGLLKVIRYGFTEQLQTQSAQKIVEEAVRLQNHITNFLLEFARLGELLDNAKEAYGKSFHLVERNIASKSRALQELGVRSTKKLSPADGRRLASRGLAIMPNTSARVMEDEGGDLYELAAETGDSNEEDEISDLPF